jgi:hypothetical protein
MSHFTDHTGIRIVAEGSYVLTDDLSFDIGRKGSGMVYTVPAGFRFAVSVPAVVRWLFSRNDFRYLRAAAVHDHMWVEGWDRQTAAAVFYRALRASYVPAWRAIAMYIAVSSFSLLYPDQTRE